MGQIKCDIGILPPLRSLITPESYVYKGIAT